MRLFVVRPSRGTWGFFALVVLGVLGARAMRRHEARVIRQDRPASQAAHDLAACLLGTHSAWVLRDPDDEGALLRWTHGAAKVFRANVAGDQPQRWMPACVDAADELLRALRRGSATAPRTYSLAMELRAQVARASTSRDERYALADGDQLAAKLAATLMQVRALSSGSRATWDQGLMRARPPVPLTPAPLPQLRGLPGAVEHPVLASTSTVFARGTWNGYSQALRVDGGRPRRVLLGNATPIVEDPSGPLARGWSDEGPRWFMSAPRPLELAPPEDLEIRDAARLQVSSSHRPGLHALLTVDEGTVRVRTIADDGRGGWSPARQVGPGESVSAATISEEPWGWSVTALRARWSDAVLERYAVRVDPEGVRVEAPRPVALSRPLPGAFSSVQTCVSGPSTYLLLAAREQLYGVRVRDDAARVITTRLTLPAGTTLRLRCDDTQALAVPEGSLTSAAWMRFERGAPVGEVIPPPPGGVNTVHAMTLVSGGVLAVASSPGALRAWRYHSGGLLRDGFSSRWEPAAALMEFTPTATVRRGVTRVQLASRGDAITLLIDIAQSPRQMRAPSPQSPDGPIEEEPIRRWSFAGRAVMVSRDGGRSFTAPY